MDLGKISQYAFPHFPMSVCLMEEIAAAQDLESQSVLSLTQIHLTVSLKKKKKKGKSSLTITIFFFLFSKRRME